MTTISQFADMLHREVQGPTPIVNKLYKIVKDKYMASGVDRSVKTSAIMAMSALLAHFSSSIGKEETDGSLLVMVERAFGESTWLNAL